MACQSAASVFGDLGMRPNQRPLEFLHLVSYHIQALSGHLQFQTIPAPYGCGTIMLSKSILQKGDKYNRKYNKFNNVSLLHGVSMDKITISSSFKDFSQTLSTCQTLKIPVCVPVCVC